MRYPQYCRYGRQTLTGTIKDGMSALSRYYLNNFHDGVRQARCLLSVGILDSTNIDESQVTAMLCIFAQVNFVSIQDAMDLISGRYTVNRNGPSPFHLNGFESFSVSILFL